MPGAIRPRSREAQPARRQGRHLADRLGEREEVLLADVSAEHPRKGAGAARVLRADPAVAPDHHPGLLRKKADVLRLHRVADHVRAAVLHDPDEELDGRDALPSARSPPGSCPTYSGCARAAGDRDAVAPPTSARARSTLSGSSYFLFGNEDLDVRVPRLVRIAVGRDVLARASRAAANRSTASRGLSPDADRAELDVGDLDGNAARAARSRSPPRRPRRSCPPRRGCASCRCRRVAPRRATCATSSSVVL